MPVRSIDLCSLSQTTQKRMRRLIKVITGIFLFTAFAGASLWATSLALEPEPFSVDGAPSPATFADPIVQVYGADVWGFRGRFAIHTWVAVKSANADAYTIYQVIGWRQRRGQPVLSISEGIPDRPWFGSKAVLLHEKRGPEAAGLIAEIENAVAAYPFAEEYKMWPGPNSNSFVAWIGLEVPKLGLDLPVKAIGQNWMEQNYGLYRSEAP